MKKKKEKIVISNEELKPTSLGEIQDNKTGIFLLFIVFLSLVLFVIGMPYITAYLEEQDMNNYNPNITGNNNDTGDNTDNNDNQNNEEDEVIKYDLTDDLILETTDFNIKNIVIENNIMSLTVVNNDDERVILDNTNYFLELYNESGVLVERIKLFGELVTDELHSTYNVKENNITKLSLLVISEDEYPEVTLKKDENDKEYLICTGMYDETTYYFNDSKLESSILKMTVLKSNSEYDTLYLIASGLNDSTNNLVGVENTFNEDTNGFTFTSNIDYSKVSNAAQMSFNAKYNDLAKNIKFNLESSGLVIDCE